MGDELHILDRPTLRRPVMIVAFRGWNDGGQGASLAAGYLAKAWDASRFAELDPEGFYDFQATRPHVSLDEGLTRRIDWPENVFYKARVEEVERDVVLLLGVEPNLRWRTFSGLVIDLARDLGVELVITLGSLLSIPIDTHELAEAEETYAEQVTEAVSTDAETAAYVEELERRTDELDLEE